MVKLKHGNRIKAVIESKHYRRTGPYTGFTEYLVKDVDLGVRHYTSLTDMSYPEDQPYFSLDTSLIETVPPSSPKQARMSTYVSGVMGAPSTSTTTTKHRRSLSLKKRTTKPPQTLTQMQRQQQPSVSGVHLGGSTQVVLQDLQTPMAEERQMLEPTVGSFEGSTQAIIAELEKQMPEEVQERIAPIPKAPAQIPDAPAPVPEAPAPIPVIPAPVPEAPATMPEIHFGGSTQEILEELDTPMVEEVKELPPLTNRQLHRFIHEMKLHIKALYRCKLPQFDKEFKKFWDAAWHFITVQVNGVDPKSTPVTADQLQKAWDQLRHRARKKESQLLIMADNVPEEDKPVMTDTEQKVLKMLEDLNKNE